MPTSERREGNPNGLVQSNTETIQRMKSIRPQSGSDAIKKFTNMKKVQLWREPITIIVHADLAERFEVAGEFEAFELA